MQWVVSPFSVALTLASLLALAIGALLWRRRWMPGSLSLGLMSFSVAVWALTMSVEMSTTSLQMKILMSKLEYLGVCTAPTLLLLFALEFVNQERWLTLRNRLLLWTTPAVVLVLAFTNEAHHLVWNSFTPIPGTNLIIYGHGAGFWVMVVYAYAIVAGSTLLLANAVVRFPNVYRQQIVLLLIGILFPWLGNIVYVFNLAPGMDLTPIGFAVTAFMIFWGVYRSGLFDLVPIARGRVLEWMEDSLIILDNNNRIVDFNPAAGILFDRFARSRGMVVKHWVGSSFELLVREWPEMERAYPFNDEGCYEVDCTIGAEEINYDLDVSLIYDRIPLRAMKLLALHDVTRLTRVRREALRSREIAAVLLETANMLSSSNDPEKGLEAVLEQISRVIAYDCGAFFLREGEQLRVVGARGFADLEEFKRQVQPDWYMAEVGLVALEKIKAACHCGGSGLVVPIHFQDHLLGALALLRQEIVGFTDEDQQIAVSLAAQVSVALENSRMFEQVQQMALTDSLTGLYNRRHFFTLAQHLYDHSSRYFEPFAIIMFDLDHFKGVNDAFGHAAGDETLRAISILCRNAVRKIDILGRYGGEEFTIALPNTNLSQAGIIAERLRRSIDQAQLAHRGQAIHITASLGVAERSGEDTLEEVIERADRALYQAKESGRNCVAEEVGLNE